MVSDVFFELGCEELPSGSVLPLAEALTTQVLAALDKAQLKYDSVAQFATPRRMAFRITGVEDFQATQKTLRRGPALAQAYDKTGQPTPALMGFAKSCGVELKDLSTLETDKGAWVVFEEVKPGESLVNLLPGIIQHALSSLPIAKPMRWGAGDAEFARPVHWAILFVGDTCISMDVLGVSSGKCSYGHRFHHPKAVPLVSGSSYEEQMEKAFVIADFAKRRAEIVSQIQKLALKLNAEVIMPDDLLDEVTSIVEWPEALLVTFDAHFLEVPPEVLIASMQVHQKCFALKDNQGKLLPYFITVANLVSQDSALVIAGNEKVMKARLSDAAFFFRQDRKQPLSAQMAATSQVIFQKNLGSLLDKSQRALKLMQYFAKTMDLDFKDATRAAELSKCDLLTGMVGEFPDLQGLMGYYYALHDKEPLAVAQALQEQYLPRFAKDDLPKTKIGLALSLADRLDTLVGIFAIGQKPTGVKDPFKLRRHALAVVRLMLAAEEPLSLSELFNETSLTLHEKCTIKSSTLEELKSFILERLPSFYANEGFSQDVVKAVLAIQNDTLIDTDKRIRALATFTNSPDLKALSAVSKRVNNLLQQAGKLDANPFSESLLEHSSEKALFQALQKVQESMLDAYKTCDYVTILQLLSSLRTPLDVFFEEVMVMVENEALKNNRLQLLRRLQDMLKGVADISLLAVS
jgi:glycyl-tRNA synthetase beta chain